MKFVEVSATQKTSGGTHLPVPFAFAVTAERVCDDLGVKVETGLLSSEIQRRRKQYGSNILPIIRVTSAWRILLRQFASLMVLLLSIAVIISWMTGERLEALAMMVVLALNALIGFLVEWQAARALKALRQQAVTVTRVRRNSREVNLDASELVPGDILILNAGDRVPADARLIVAASVRTEESALTGESATLEKNIVPVDARALLVERHSMLYLGTSMVGGRAIAVVTATGLQTELGKIGRLTASAAEETTPLEQRLQQLGRRLVWLVLGIAVIILFAGWWRGDDLWLMTKTAISLAVAAVPEGLPAVTTLILALGVLRMARQHALVRRLSAVETLGSTTIICADKTGTLTENRMTVQEYHLADGTIVRPMEIPSLAGNSLLQNTLLISVLCNEAVIEQDSAEPQKIGDPTETALLMAAQQAGVNLIEWREIYSKLDDLPFDAATRHMLTLHRTPDNSRLIAMKGAPSVVLSHCTTFVSGGGLLLPLLDKHRRRLLAVNEQMASRSLRVLALAEKRLAASRVNHLTETDTESEFTFLGFVGMSDPARAEVFEAIAQAGAAGIRVVMLTGDQLKTAVAIARELRLNDNAEPVALHAQELAEASAGQIAEMAAKADVFARVSPEDKFRIVQALRQHNEIVAVTGDGINDAPALRSADIGVAMGLRGTEVAKEVADLVLADDNFATIVQAIKSGRTIYTNIQKFVHLMFSENLAEVLVIMTAIVLGWPLPLLPLQILWINLVTDVFPALALALEPASPDVMQRPPRSPQVALLSRPFLWLIFWQAMMLAVITLAAYGWALSQYGPGAHARTIALFSMTGTQLGHMFNCRSRSRSALSGLFRNPSLWLAGVIVAALQILAIQYAPLSGALDVIAPDLSDWAVIAGSVIAPLAIVELAKLVYRHQSLQKHRTFC
jgi:Ca2+-transporting ATPase